MTIRAVSLYPTKTLGWMCHRYYLGVTAGSSLADGFEYELLFDTCSLLLGVVYGVDVDTDR